MSMLAAGLAWRVSPEFAWANCSGSTADWAPPVRTLLEDGSSGRRVESLLPDDLAPHEVRTQQLSEMLSPQGLTVRSRERLLEFLRLPDLLQRLVASSPSRPGP